MSTIAPIQTQCPACQAPHSGRAVVCANLPRLPSARQAIMEGRLNRQECSECGSHFEYRRTVAAVDFERKLWVVAYTPEGERYWRDCVSMTERGFRRCMHIQAPPMIRNAADEWTVRTVFGHAALREKLVVDEAELSDVKVETAKLAILAGRPEWTGAKVRLFEVLDGELRWLVVTMANEKMYVVSDRSLLESPLPRGFLPGELGSDPFVDIRRFFVAPVPADSTQYNLAGHDVPAGFPELDPRYG